MQPLRFFNLPVQSPITGRFGDWYSNQKGTYQHRGIDFGCDIGTPVYAPATGVVVPVFNPSGDFGVAVALAHIRSNGTFYTLYAHLSSVAPDARIGSTIYTGQLLGYSGATGFVSGAHLHWQLSTNNLWPASLSANLDPYPFYSPGDDDDVPDPRFDSLNAKVDKIIQVLFGSEGVLDMEVAKGNNYTLGYALEQQEQNLLEQKIAMIEQQLTEIRNRGIAGMIFPGIV